jgi:hypothetical protein
MPLHDGIGRQHLDHKYACREDQGFVDINAMASNAVIGGSIWAEPSTGQFDLRRWPNAAGWAERVKTLPGFKAPFELSAMADAKFI